MLAILALTKVEWQFLRRLKLRKFSVFSRPLRWLRLELWSGGLIYVFALYSAYSFFFVYFVIWRINLCRLSCKC